MFWEGFKMSILSALVGNAAVGATVAIPFGLAVGAGVGIVYVSKRVTDYFFGSPTRSNILAKLEEEISQIDISCNDLARLNKEISSQRKTNAEMQQRVEAEKGSIEQQNELIKELIAKVIENARS